MRSQRFLMQSVCVALFLFGCALQAFAQSWPTKPVRMIVPFPPGQATDIVARLLAESLSRQWGQSVVVDNRGGGGGIPGMLAGRDVAPDGYTLTFGTSGTIGANPGLYNKLPYDPVRDFSMVGGVFIVPLMWIAHPSVPYLNLREMLEAAKKSPASLNWAYAGTGTSQHLTGELFQLRAGVTLTGVPYKGSGPAMQDVLGGQIGLMVDSLASALPHIRGGKIRPLAMTTLTRVPQLPDVPTVAESGFPGFEGNGWGGLVVPSATPRDLVERIGADVRKSLNDPSMQEKLVSRGTIPDARGPREFEAFVRAEVSKWSEIARRANIRLD